MEPKAKYFKKREAILDCLRSTTTHPSAEMVYGMLQQEHPDISLATVYRNLKHFQQQGLITGIATVRGTERFDARTDPHVHFICECCDAVLDLDAIPIPMLSSAVEEKSGCQVHDCRLIFTGVCPNCGKNQNSQSA